MADRPPQNFAQIAEDVLRRNTELAICRSALEKVLCSLLVEYARVDAAVVDLAERDDRCEGHPAVSALEWPRLKQRENERRNLVGKLWVGLATKRGHLGALHGIEQPELRLDDSGMRLRTAELGRDCFVQIDEILDAQVTDAAVSL